MTKDRWMGICKVCNESIVRQKYLKKYFGREIWLHVSDKVYNHEAVQK